MVRELRDRKPVSYNETWLTVEASTSKANNGAQADQPTLVKFTRKGIQNTNSSRSMMLASAKLQQQRNRTGVKLGRKRQSVRLGLKHKQTDAIAALSQNHLTSGFQAHLKTCWKLYLLCSDQDDEASDAGSADSDEANNADNAVDADDFQAPAAKRRSTKSAYDVNLSDDQSDSSNDNPTNTRSKRQSRQKPVTAAVRRQPGRAAAGKVKNLAEASDSEEESASDDPMSEDHPTGRTSARPAGRTGDSANDSKSADSDCSMREAESGGAVTSVSDSEEEESDKENKPAASLNRCHHNA